jgi:hypothetical protein
MRAFACAAGFVMAAALGGCAQGISLPDMPMFGAASADALGEGAAVPQIQMATFNPADMPPLPERNPGKRPAAVANTANKKTGGGFSLASLAQMNLLTAGSPVVPDSVHWGASPVAAYTLIAQQIHACWLTPGAPKLPNHGFHADVSPKDGSTAKIVLYEKGPDRKRGLLAYKITIGESSGGSLVTSENRRLDAKLEAVFKADLARWAKGDLHCKG